MVVNVFDQLLHPLCSPPLRHPRCINSEVERSEITGSGGAGAGLACGRHVVRSPRFEP